MEPFHPVHPDLAHAICFVRIFQLRKSLSMYRSVQFSRKRHELPQFSKSKMFFDISILKSSKKL